MQGLRPSGARSGASDDPGAWIGGLDLHRICQPESLAMAILVVLCTCPVEAAPALARGLVDKRLAACVNLLPQVQSIYRWQDQVQQDNESLLLIKTTSERYAQLEQHLREHHPYSVPEVLAVPASLGLEAYLQWVVEAVDPGAASNG
jgi:periplasmic divalent cation tolerance protein